MHNEENKLDSQSWGFFSYSIDPCTTLTHYFDYDVTICIMFAMCKCYSKLQKVPWEARIPSANALTAQIQIPLCPKNLKIS